MRLFLDTNLFLCYATDFEKKHTKCQRIFNEDYRRYTGKRVVEELEKIKRRRVPMYRDIISIYKSKDPLRKLMQQYRINPNDLKHLSQLITHLRRMDKTKALTYLRQVSRLIERGVQYALSRVIKPLIQPSGDLTCEAAIEKCIGNFNDARILVDALCWAEKTKPATFCTLDYSDIIARRELIYNRICRIRSYSPWQNPLKIEPLSKVIK